MRRLFGIALVVASALWSPGDAHAQLAEIEGEPDARTAFQMGQASFHNGQYEGAMRAFQEAYRLEPRPELLYQIGESARRAGRLRRALDALERYLRETSAVHPRRASVERKVTELREAIARGDADVPEGPGAAPWIVAAVGGALLVAGAILLGAGIGSGDDTLLGVSIPFLAVGVVGVAGGLYWGLSSRSHGEGAEAAAILTPCGAVFLGSF